MVFIILGILLDWRRQGPSRRACAGRLRVKMKSKMQVMKFGGTSVGDASCIARAEQIVAKAARENAVAVVVSAMSGVTNRLVAAAHRAGSGDGEAGAEV